MTGWAVYFHQPLLTESRVWRDTVVTRYADQLARFLLTPDGLVDVRVNGWFASYEMRALTPATWRKYAYSLKPWLSFLSVCDLPWDDVDSRAQAAFKDWRMIDTSNPRSVAPGTYKLDLIAIRLFYIWAGSEFGIANPIRMRRGPGRRPDGAHAQEPETTPRGTRDRDVKWFDPRGYARFRDVGMVGLTADGQEDRSFRGRNSQRDAAFADGLYGTGLRLQEWGSTLLPELPEDDPARQYRTCTLAAATAKGGYRRHYWMPRRALVSVLDYVEGERATVVRRAQRSGRYACDQWGQLT